MKRAIVTHRVDFAAIVALLIAAIAVVVYVLGHQPSFTFGKSYYTVYAPFQTGAAVTAGQGQSVDIAGVQVGQIGGVKLEDGRAIVTMNIYKQYSPIYGDATVLLRPRTPLKDMYLSLDRGTPQAGAIPSGGTLPVANTSPDVDFDQILSSLDADTRSYLLLLLAGGAQAFRDPGNPGPLPSQGAVADLRGTFQRFAPLNRDTKTLTTLLAERQQNIRRAIHNLQLVTRSIGGVHTQLASLIRSSNTNFAAISSQDANLEEGLTLFPGTLQQTTQALGKVQRFAEVSTPTLKQLLPFAHALGPALAASQPLFKDTTPSIQNQLRPFSVAVQPVARILSPASASLAKATPPLTRSLNVFNTLFDELAYKQRGAKQSYLYWGSWLAHIADSLGSLQDAQGPILRGTFMGTCAELNLFENSLAPAVEALAARLALANPPPVTKLPNYTPPQIPGIPGTCPGG